eukprot:2564993-Rhodomonas_salina.1
MSVREIRVRIATSIGERWEAADGIERTLMSLSMGMGIERYLDQVRGDMLSDAMMMDEVSRIIGGSIAVWVPGDRYEVPEIWKEESTAVEVKATIQWVNVEREGRLDHFEPLIRDVKEDEQKGSERVRTNKGSRRGKGKKTGAVAFKAVNLNPIRAKPMPRWMKEGKQSTCFGWPNVHAAAFNPSRLQFVDKKEKRRATAARAHWGLFYFVYGMQQHQRGEWDLKSLASMALHPKISKEAALSIWELGWQEAVEEDSLPKLDADFNHMDGWEGMKLWWASHQWASDCEEGGRADLVMGLANLGPAGVWASLGSTVRELAEKRLGIILLGDLRISKKS